MKKINFILAIMLIVSIVSCRNSEKQNQATIHSNTKDSILADSVQVNKVITTENEEKNFRQIGLDEKIGNLSLRDYLSDKEIPQVFKDVFQQRRRLDDDEKTLAIIDSLSSIDKKRHPFYFVLVTRTMWWADGAFAEPLGMAAKDYVESNTQQFLDYFSVEPVLTTFDFEQWAKQTLGEILI
jgi:hypothetical protein